MMLSAIWNHLSPLLPIVLPSIFRDWSSQYRPSPAVIKPFLSHLPRKREVIEGNACFVIRIYLWRIRSALIISSDAEWRSSAETWEENDDKKLSERSFTGKMGKVSKYSIQFINWNSTNVCPVIGNLIGQKLRTSHTMQLLWITVSPRI